MGGQFAKTLMVADVKVEIAALGLGRPEGLRFPLRHVIIDIDSAGDELGTELAPLGIV
jgi:hypothetical protein